MSDDTQDDVEVTTYEPPHVVRLGSLTELTQGGTTGLDDGMGGGGDGGSI